MRSCCRFCVNRFSGRRLMIACTKRGRDRSSSGWTTIWCSPISATPSSTRRMCGVRSGLSRSTPTRRLPSPLHARPAPRPSPLRPESRASRLDHPWDRRVGSHVGSADLENRRAQSRPVRDVNPRERPTRKLLGQRSDLSRGPAFPYRRSATLGLRFGRTGGRRGGGGALDEGGLDQHRFAGWVAGDSRDCSLHRCSGDRRRVLTDRGKPSPGCARQSAVVVADDGQLSWNVDARGPYGGQEADG